MERIKAEMTAYWTARAEDFAQLRLREFSGNMHQRWLGELNKYLPQGRPLRILDLGTGTGFFTFLLTAEGHQVTGIDLTEEMISEAKRSAQILGLPGEFLVMDAERPDLPPESFDALVTRNLTWALPHLPDAYRAWRRLLKKGGVLINFDADYCREDESKPLPKHHAHSALSHEEVDAYEHMKDELRPSQRPRPDWDRELLTQAGFHHIQVDTQVYRRIYREFDEFYNPTPIFALAAFA